MGVGVGGLAGSAHCMCCMDELVCACVLVCFVVMGVRWGVMCGL